jgi:hypothetical protein
MITRRRAILGIGLGSSLAAWGFAPGEFWDDKQPSEWSEKEVQRMLTKSPWAKEAGLEVTGGRGGRGMGGPGGRGPGGPGWPFGMQPTVRWDSAAPLRSAAKVKLPIDPTVCYVIGVLGLPTDMDARFGELNLASLKETTFLQRKGGKPVAPNHFIVSDFDGAMLFYFPSDADPISAVDNEVVFQTKIVVYAMKVKFVPKDMQYRGKLAL